jgi:pilus assembly protein CpaB
MRVDVLISGNPPSATPSHTGSLTRTLLQNIEILSAGQEYKKDSEGKPIVVQVVNVLVSPEQDEKLSLAINQTTIQLVLRNPLDTEIAKTNGTALSQLFGAATPKPETDKAVRPARRAAPAAPAVPVVKEAPKEPFVMEVINGGKKTEAKFSGAAGEAKQ